MAITPLPTPPSREDPTNFATRADAFMAALPDFATETNAVAVEVDADRVSAAASASSAATQVGLATTQVGLASAQRVLAEAAANAASATANAVQWVSGTTYTIGQNVWSPVDYQTYRRITNGAGTTDPTLDIVNWTKLTGSAGGFGAGATVYSNVTTKTTYTLTSSSTSVIEIESKVLGNIVKLPDATAMNKGKGLFNIRNSGSLPFIIEDFAGNFLGGVAGATEVSVSLNTNTTQAGTWDLTDVACRSVESTQFGISLLSVFTGGGTYGLQVLNSTQFVIFGTFTSYMLAFQVITYDVETNSFSASSVYSVIPEYTFGGECVRIGTSNRFFAIARNTSTHYGYVIDLTTPNSPVIGSQTTLVTNNNTTYTSWGSTIANNGEPFGKSRYTVPVKGSPHKLVNCYQNTTTGQLAGYVIDCGTSGTTITVGTASNFPDASTGNQYPQINALTSFATDKIGAIFRYYDGGTYYNRGTIGTVSGNSITWSNSTTIISGATNIGTAALGVNQTLGEQDKFVVYAPTTGVANIITFATGGMTVGTALEGVPSGSSGQIIVTKNGFMIYSNICDIASYTFSGSNITNVTTAVNFGASAPVILSTWTNASADAVAIGSNNATYFVKQNTDGSMQLNQIGTASNRVVTYSINASGKHAVIAHSLSVANINLKYMFGSVATNGRFSPEKVIARVDQGYAYNFQSFYLQVAQKLWSELSNGQLRGFTFTGQESNPVYIGESGFRDFLISSQVNLYNSTELSSSLIAYATSTTTVESIAPVRVSLIRHN